MIRANSWIKVEFDDESRERVEEAISTMTEVCDAIGKVTSNCGWTDCLYDAIGTLRDMLNGEEY